MTEAELRTAAELWMTYHDERPQSGHADAHRQAKLLARAYLDSHPADDGVAVDEPWLRAAGFAPTNPKWCDIAPTYEWSIPMEHNRLAVWLPDGEVFMRAGRQLFIPLAPPCPTRGHVRRLCAALGIRLQERAP